MILWLLAVALADPSVDDDVRITDGQVTHDWTTMRVEVVQGGTGGGVGGQPALEMRLRSAIQPTMHDALASVPIHGDVTATDLFDDSPTGSVLVERVKHWQVTEARYMASGRIELLGAIDLALFLRPWMIEVAQPVPADPAATPWTGVVVDARGLSVRHAFSPRLVDVAGAVLYDGGVWANKVLAELPVIYVYDAAHPAAQRAGDQPLVVKAVGARGADLVIERDGAAAMQADLAGSRVLGDGTVVIVVDR